MALSRMKEVQEKQVRAVVLCHLPEGWGSVFWELPRGNHLFFPFGNVGRQMTWRKDTAIKVILATGKAEKDGCWWWWLGLRYFLHSSSWRFFCSGSKWRSKVHPSPLCGRLFHKMTEWKVVSAEIPLHFMSRLSVHPRKHPGLFQQPAESSLLFWKRYRKKKKIMNWGIPDWLGLGISFSLGHQLRENRKKNRSSNKNKK